MNELTEIKQRILEEIELCLDKIDDPKDTRGYHYSIAVISKETVRKIIESEFARALLEAPDTEHIIKSTIKEYIGKPHDDVTELLLALNKDLCERIRKENMNGL